MHDINQLANDLKQNHNVRFQENGWDIGIQIRNGESSDVTLSNHPDYGDMVINGWYFFKAQRIAKEAIRLANMPLGELEDIRSNPDGWPPADRHIWYIQGWHTGHPNQTGKGCLFVLIPIIGLFFLLIITLCFFQ